MTLRAPSFEHALGPLEGPDASADAARQPRADGRHDSAVVARVLCRIQIDQLHFREPGEPRDPAVEVVGRHRELLTLDELDDTAALQIDGGNQHQSLTGTPRARRYPLRSADRVLGEMKDRRRQRRVRARPA